MSIYICELLKGFSGKGTLLSKENYKEYFTYLFWRSPFSHMKQTEDKTQPIDCLNQSKNITAKKQLISLQHSIIIPV